MGRLNRILISVAAFLLLCLVAAFNIGYSLLADVETRVAYLETQQHKMSNSLNASSSADTTLGTVHL